MHQMYLRIKLKKKLDIYFTEIWAGYNIYIEFKCSNSYSTSSSWSSQANEVFTADITCKQWCTNLRQT